MSKETVQEKVQKDVQVDQLSDLEQNRELITGFNEAHGDGRVFLIGTLFGSNQALHINKESPAYKKVLDLLEEETAHITNEINKLEKL